MIKNHTVVIHRIGGLEIFTEWVFFIACVIHRIGGLEICPDVDNIHRIGGLETANG